MTTTLELINYYAKLLIKQYENKPKAYATILSIVTPIVMAQTSVQKISFSLTPTSGTFILSYNGNNTSNINWNDNATTIQTELRLLPELSEITVTGSIDIDTGLTVTFTGINNVAESLIVLSNSLLGISTKVKISVNQTDLTLPLAVQDAFNLISINGSKTAVGVQLDILGKYAGVKRTVNTKTKTVNLDDTDFLTLIKFAIVKNNSGSSLYTIEKNLNMFFPGDFIVTDFKTMNMSFIFGSSLGSSDLFLALIAEDLLPVPMAVGYSAIVPPVIDQFFGYVVYESDLLPHGNKPYNTYEDINYDWKYLQYSDFI